MQEFIEDFKRKSKMGFLMGLILLIGFEAMDNHDTDDVHKKGGDFMEIFQEMMSNWVKENPDKSAQLCSSIQEMVDDYLLFGELH